MVPAVPRCGGADRDLRLFGRTSGRAEGARSADALVEQQVVAWAQVRQVYAVIVMSPMSDL